MAYRQETIKPYDDLEPKGRQVEAMFNGIARHYDRLNHLLSLGIDRRWRRAAVKTLETVEHDEVLDVATGTGDFALLCARQLENVRVTACDIAESMMQVGREKARRQGLDNRITFERQDCMALPYQEGRFDAVTVAYGVRNFEDLERGLRQMHRVLRVGGHLVIQELTAPPQFPMKQLFWLYSHCWMPLLGRLLSRDGRAYRYLPATMEAFPQGEVMQGVLEKVGFAHVTFRRLTCGLCTLYVAEK